MALAQSEIFEDAFPLFRSCPALNEIRLVEEIKDLTIEVRDQAALHAHRIILAARIPSLRKTLSGPHSGQNTLLKWPTVPLSVATVFVNYVYTGQAELTQANVRDVVMFARIVKLPVIENLGQNFMANSYPFYRVTIANLATTWGFARSLNNNFLTEKCLSLMRQHFEEFVATDLFLRMPAGTVLTLLRSDDLSVGSEEQVIRAISHWVCSGDKADDDKRKVHAPAMLKEVQWHLTTFKFRSHLMERYSVFQKSPECLLLMFQIANGLGAAEKDKMPCPFNVRSRQWEERVAGVHSGSSADNKRPPRRGIEGEPNVEHRFAKMPRYAYVTVSRPPPQTHIFLFGRDKDDRSRWTLLRYDPRHQKAQRVADMEARWLATFSVVGDAVFALGSSWGTGNSVETLTPPATSADSGNDLTS